MSASPVARQVTQSQAIPRRVTITSTSQLPNDYSTTPGGTIYSTTPGGTRIVYERAFLMNLRNSPIARTPPKNLQMIPGLTTSPSISPSKLVLDSSNATPVIKQSEEVKVSVQAAQGGTPGVPVDEQFQMEL
ncbi:Eukaryotic translation initiation factor 4E-binding protein 3 [Orchesella cincta]|uniref:Eukaryotic translation initiation factor 4E-binding protein 3 n=1 Tax=Orchesella cincta TaxID=48709 RepID=A0A1D2NIK7_ORCCI|nr:Eukaryotic translation initiation factor 4E-binding protein 3 [Orchesella cincta]